MTEHRDEPRDPELRAEFDALRERRQARASVPDFNTMMARARAQAAEEDRAATGTSRTTFLRLGRWIPLAAAAGLAGLLLVGEPGSEADAEFERLVADYASQAAGWRSPTASLLDIPGVDLGAVPSFGGSLGGPALPDTDTPEGRDS